MRIALGIILLVYSGYSIREGASIWNVSAGVLGAVSLAFGLAWRIRVRQALRREESDVDGWTRRVLNDEHAWKFGLSDERRDYLNRRTTSEVDTVVSRIIEVLNSNPEYWQFCNCTMLIEEALRSRATEATDALSKHIVGHDDDSGYRTQALKALKAMGVPVPKEPTPVAAADQPMTHDSLFRAARRGEAIVVFSQTSSLAAATSTSLILMG